MNTETQAPKGTKTKNFGRTYDYAAGTVTIAVLGRPDAGTILKFDALPEETRKAFALQAYADYVVQNANDVVRESSLDDGIAALKDAQVEAEDGSIEFREGMGLGMASAPMAKLLGRALVEAGYKFAKFRGVTYTFEGDIAKAQEAMRTLYNDTEPENGYTDPANKKGPQGETGRQRFRRIAEQEKVAAVLATYKKAKVTATPEDALG